MSTRNGIMVPMFARGWCLVFANVCSVVMADVCLKKHTFWPKHRTTIVKKKNIIAQLVLVADSLHLQRLRQASVKSVAGDFVHILTSNPFQELLGDTNQTNQFHAAESHQALSLSLVDP